ncbi:hypothetical protein HanPI659440_Chr04g0152451 [Helianthus annuus]|nr:hypothetical protein HanPI659440_Chr04g0152451 [Helianthus annuus]
MRELIGLMRFVEADEFDCSEVRVLVLVLLITGSGTIAVVAEPTRRGYEDEDILGFDLYLSFVVHLGFGIYEDLHMHKRIYNNSK